MHEHKAADYIDCLAYSSGLRNWNAGFKVLFALIGIFTVILAENIWISLFTLLFMTYLTVNKGKISFHTYIHLMEIPLVFIILGSIAVGIQFSSMPKGDYRLYLYFGYLYFTRQGLWSMFCLMTKAFAAISAMYMMTLSTPVGDFIMVLKKAHLPGLVVELMHFIYRYIFVLLNTYQKMQKAAEARLGYIDTRTAFRTFGKNMGNLLILSMRKAGNSYDAMESRCYDETCDFYCEPHALDKKQVFSLIFYLMCIILICFVLFP